MCLKKILYTCEKIAAEKIGSLENHRPKWTPEVDFSRFFGELTKKIFSCGHWQSSQLRNFRDFSPFLVINRRHSCMKVMWNSKAWKIRIKTHSFIRDTEWRIFNPFNLHRTHHCVAKKAILTINNYPTRWNPKFNRFADDFSLRVSTLRHNRISRRGNEKKNWMCRDFICPVFCSCSDFNPLCDFYFAQIP